MRWDRERAAAVRGQVVRAAALEIRVILAARVIRGGQVVRVVQAALVARVTLEIRAIRAIRAIRVMIQPAILRLFTTRIIQVNYRLQSYHPLHPLVWSFTTWRAHMLGGFYRTRIQPITLNQRP